MNKEAKNVDEYIASFAQPVKSRLEEMRAIIRKAAPGAAEVISYGMPTYKRNKALVHFAGYQKHIGFYPTPSAITAFEKEIKKYPYAKGSVQFAPDVPLPASLIKKMVTFRLKEDAALSVNKKEKVSQPEKKPGNKKPATVTVTTWLAQQEPGVKKAINAVRKIIHEAAPELHERIKWNAPSFYSATDIVTFGPSKNGNTMLVFHHPAVTTIKSGLLEGDYKDRRLAQFSGTADIKKKKPELIRILKEHMKLIS